MYKVTNFTQNTSLWWQFWTCQWWNCLGLHLSDKLPAIMSLHYKLCLISLCSQYNKSIIHFYHQNFVLKKFYTNVHHQIIQLLADKSGYLCNYWKENEYRILGNFSLWNISKADWNSTECEINNKIQTNLTFKWQG